MIWIWYRKLKKPVTFSNYQLWHMVSTISKRWFDFFCHCPSVFSAMIKNWGMVTNPVIGIVRNSPCNPCTRGLEYVNWSGFIVTNVLAGSLQAGWWGLAGNGWKWNNLWLRSSLFGFENLQPVVTGWRAREFQHEKTKWVRARLFRRFGVRSQMSTWLVLWNMTFMTFHILSGYDYRT